MAVVDALQEAGIDYALCGGVALSIHGYVRATEDIDLLVRPQDVERARDAVRAQGFCVATPGALVFARETPQEIVVHRVSKFAGEDFLTLDLMVVPGALEDVWAGREKQLWEGREISVVSVEGLAAMKRRAGRKQDLADLERLGFSDE